MNQLEKLAKDIQNNSYAQRHRYMECNNIIDQ